MHTKKSVLLIRIALLLLIFLLLILGCRALLRKEDALPQLNVYGDIAEMASKKDVRSVTVSFQNGEQEFQAHATIKLQGTSSLSYDKKNYTIKFFEDADHTRRKDINVGWGDENTYCLKANWIDKTHARNIVTAQLAAEVQLACGVLEQAPCNGLIDGFPIEVYANDEYLGLYTWNIPKGAWQFGMDEDNPDHIVMCGESWEDAATFYAEPDLDSWSIEAGPENDEALAKFALLSDFIRNSSDEEFRRDLSQHLDLDALLNYYILVDFAYLPDNCAKNMLLATYDGQVWYPSLYDLDTSWGTFYTGETLWEYDDTLVDFAGKNNLARRLETAFPRELHDRYFGLRQTLLTREHVLELFDRFDSQISHQTKLREQQKWGDQIPGYELDQVEDYLDSVIGRLDAKYQRFA